MKNDVNCRTLIHRGNRTEIILTDGPEPADGPYVEKRLLAFANVSTERHALFREAVMQCLGKGPGVIRVIAPCPGQLAEEEMPSLTRQFINGRTLRELRDEPRLSSREYLALIASLMETLARLHALVDERGVRLELMHRDVTPGNVIVDEEYGVWLNDFGLALTGDELPLAADETLQGTRRFLAPELVRGEQPSSASDVYQAMLLGAYLLDSDRRDPPLELEARTTWANTLLDPHVATTAFAKDPALRPTSSDLALLLRTICAG